MAFFKGAGVAIVTAMKENTEFRSSQGQDPTVPGPQLIFPKRLRKTALTVSFL